MLLRRKLPEAKISVGFWTLTARISSSHRCVKRLSKSSAPGENLRAIGSPLAIGSLIIGIMSVAR
jgi:hypothetical protein